MIASARRSSSLQLIGMAVFPALNSIERFILRMRLRHSAMSVEVLERQIDNDRAALCAVYDTANPKETLRALRQQIALASSDIQSEHLLQANLNSRLALLNTSRDFFH